MLRVQPTLRRISLDGCTHVDDACLLAIATASDVAAAGTMTGDDSTALAGVGAGAATTAVAKPSPTHAVTLPGMSPPGRALLSLSLHSCSKVTDAGVAALLRRPDLLAGMRSITLTRCAGITAVGAAALLHAAATPVPGAAPVSASPAAASAAREPPTAPAQSRLRTVRVSGVADVDDGLLAAVAQLAGTSLRTLDVGCAVPPEAGIVLGDLHDAVWGAGALETPLLSESRGSDSRGSSRVASTASSGDASPTDGDAQGVDGDDGRDTVSPVSEDTRAAVASTDVTDSGVVVVAKACSGLTRLGLQGRRRVTDASVLALGAVPSIAGSMRHLDLRACRITDTALRVLASFSSLAVLQLYGCTRLTDVGLAALAAGPCAKSLRRVDLTGCTQITVAGVRTLLAATSGTLETLALGNLPRVQRDTTEAELRFLAAGVSLQWW